jgi:hypothetical protein
VSIDERDVSAVSHGLRALSDLPPAAPATRAEGAVRRARSIRRRRAAGTVALVLLVALPVAGVVLQRSPKHPVPPVAAAYTDWPDLRNPEWVAGAKVAQQSWPFVVVGPDRPVRWLYADRVPGTDKVMAAWAVCEVRGCTDIALAYADADKVTAPPPEPGQSNWSHFVGEIDPATPAAPLSWIVGGDGDSEVLFVLPPPGTRSVTYSSPALRPGTGGSGSLSRVGGAFSGVLGYLSAPVTIQVDGVPYAVGVPGLDEVPVGKAPEVTAPTLPAPYHFVMSTHGQISEHHGDDFTNLTPPVAEWYVVYARCVGTAPMRVTTLRSERTLPCDGKVREAALEHRRRAPGRFQIVAASTDPYTSFGWTFGARN